MKDGDVMVSTSVMTQSDMSGGGDYGEAVPKPHSMLPAGPKPSHAQLSPRHRRHGRLWKARVDESASCVFPRHPARPLSWRTETTACTQTLTTPSTTVLSSGWSAREEITQAAVSRGSFVSKVVGSCLNNTSPTARILREQLQKPARAPAGQGLTFSKIPGYSAKLTNGGTTVVGSLLYDEMFCLDRVIVLVFLFLLHTSLSLR